MKHPRFTRQLGWYSVLVYGAAGGVAAQMYQQGTGVEQDDAQAVYWYRMAAEQGNRYAQGRLDTLLFLSTQTVEQILELGRSDFEAGNDIRAVSLFRRAARQGSAAGQFFLGQMYMEGRGVSHNHAQAIHWYRVAAEQGHADALVMLDILLGAQ